MGASTRFRQAWALRLAALLLSLVALTAIVAVVRGSFGEIEGRITTSAAMILLAAAVAAIGLEARARASAPRVGLAAAALAAAAAILGVTLVWLEVDPVPEWLPRAMSIAAVWAGAFGLHAGLASWARRPRWLIVATLSLGYAGAALSTGIIAREDATTAEVRALASVAILLVLGLVLTPILAALEGRRPREGTP